MRGFHQLQDVLFDWFERQPGGDLSDEYTDHSIEAFTSQGDHRQRNEDRIAYVEINQQAVTRSPLALAIVTDGLGGHAGGERAASLAIAALTSYVALGDSFGGLRSLLMKATLYANEQVYALLGGQGGTTLSAIAYGKQGCVGVNVGDSRIYATGPQGIKRLTVDDTLAEQIHRTQKTAIGQEKDDRLLQFVGIGRDLEPHSIDLPSVSMEPDAGYLITTDGAHFLGDENIAALFRRGTAAKHSARALVEMSRLLGSTDNASAIVCPRGVVLPRETDGAAINVRSPGRMFTAVLTPSREVRQPTPTQPYVTSQPPLFELPEVTTSIPQRPLSKKEKTSRSRKPTSKSKKGKRSAGTKTRTVALELIPASKGDERKK